MVLFFSFLPKYPLLPPLPTLRWAPLWPRFVNPSSFSVLHFPRSPLVSFCNKRWTEFPLDSLAGSKKDFKKIISKKKCFYAWWFFGSKSRVTDQRKRGPCLKENWVSLNSQEKNQSTQSNKTLFKWINLSNFITIQWWHIIFGLFNILYLRVSLCL